MARRVDRILIAAAAFAASVGAAEAQPSLRNLPVTDMKRVAPAEYRDASAGAARGATPVEIALKIAGAFEGSTQEIVQVNEGAEAPSASRVTVLRDGLLDDAVRGDRWDIALDRTPAGVWKINEVRRAWRCRRGGQLDRFATALCP